MQNTSGPQHLLGHLLSFGARCFNGMLWHSHFRRRYWYDDVMTLPDWRQFPYHRPGSALSFPGDEGWHRLLGSVANPSLSHMEWVYLNAHLREKGGARRHFVVFVAYFTQHIRFLVIREFDRDYRYVRTHSGSAWGLLEGGEGELDLTFRHAGGRDRWARKHTHGIPVPFASELEAVDDAEHFSLRLSMESQKRPYEAGGLGHLPFGHRGSFFYYSLTRLAIGGELRIPAAPGNREVVQVEGTGWFDHQWGPFFVTPLRTELLEQYEWMSIQLDNGDDLMLTTVWLPDGQTPSLPSFGGAGLISAGEDWQRLVGAHRWRRTGFWRTPKQGTVYSSAWTFDAPEWDIHLTITPRVSDQLTPIMDESPGSILGPVQHILTSWTNWLGDFWEGTCHVEGTVRGVPVTGNAFAELIRRYEDPRVAMELVRDEPGLAVVHWKVENPDEQVPLTHEARLLTRDGSVLRTWSDLEVPVVVLDDPALPRNTPLKLRVTASSVDATLRGSAELSLRLR